MMGVGCGGWVGRQVGRLMEGVSSIMGRLGSMGDFFFSFFRFSPLRRCCGTEREMTPTYKIQKHGTGEP